MLAASHGGGETRRFAVNSKACQVLDEIIGAEIEPLRREVKRGMLFNLVMHDPDALFKQIAHREAVAQADDVARRQTGRRRDARSIVAARTILRESDSDEHDSRDSAKADSVRAKRNRCYESNE